MKRTNPEEVVKDPANPTAFGPPLIAPGVTDPGAFKYAQQIAERKGLPKFAPPVAGGPSPMMPRLDAPAAEGLTMADQAAMHRAAEAGPPPVLGAAPRGGMFQESAPQRPQAPAAQPFVAGISQPPGILATDVLPPEAQQDPAYREGGGSMYATAQPHLAYKYGVIRGTQKIPPQQLGQAQPGLSQKTLDGIKAIQQAQTGAAPHPLLDNDDKRIEREAAAGPGGAAGRLAGGDGSTQPAMSREEALETAKKMDDFDFNAFRERMMKDMLNNEEQRALIEARCKPLSLEELITKGSVTQRVPIVADKFEPEFQSMSGEEDLAIKRLIMLESKSLEVSDRYLLDKFSIMSIVLGVRSINGTLLIDHRDQHGRFNDDKFWAKFNFLTNYPFHMLASLGVNYYWFDVRVRTLFKAEKLGNG